MPFFRHILLYEGEDPQTQCGCIPEEPSGMPTQFEMHQFRGHIFFKWSDESQCESGFAFTRNGVGLAANYFVTEQQPCSFTQEPQSFSDDLTVQPG